MNLNYFDLKLVKFRVDNFSEIEGYHPSFQFLTSHKIFYSHSKANCDCKEKQNVQPVQSPPSPFIIKQVVKAGFDVADNKIVENLEAGDFIK